MIKEELKGSSRDDAIASLKDLSGVFDKIDQASQSGEAEWPHVPGKIVSAANSSAAWYGPAEEIEDEYYDELQRTIDMLEDKEGTTNPHGFRTVEYAHSINHPMADELAAAMTRAVDVALPYVKSLVGSGSGMTENKMKLSKTKLNQIIKEEILNLQEEEGEKIMAAISDVPAAAEKIADKVRSEIEGLAEPSGLDPLVLAQAVAALLTAD